YVPAADEGWTRWLFDRFGFRYSGIRNGDILSGKLSARYDVIVFPDMQPQTLQDGYRSGSMPPEYAGGVGDAGAEMLREFASKGGTLVFLNDASQWAANHLHLSVRNVQ